MFLFEKEVPGNQNNIVIDGVHVITLPAIASIPGVLRSQDNFISYQFSTLITNLMQSEDKLFFILHSTQTTSLRKEWRLCRIEFQYSIKKDKHAFKMVYF